MLPLYDKLSAALHNLKLDEVAKLEFECVLPIAAMELAGMALDRGLLAWLGRQSRARPRFVIR